MTHVEELPARPGATAPWPEWVPDLLRTRLRGRGVAQPWAHQASAASLAHSGQSVVVATGTASGKSLAYQLPGLADERSRVLYLAPTKVLAGDQLRTLLALELPSVRAATFDGDTPFEERDWVRAHANWVLTNRDMVHRGFLPGHARWASFFRRLRYVVVDECHTYRGLFGSHVAQVLRRVRALYGSSPVFVLGVGDGVVADHVCLAPRRAPGDGGDRRCLAPRLDGVRTVGAAADRLARRARRAGASLGRFGGGTSARRPGGRGRADAGLRPVAARSRVGCAGSGPAPDRGGARRSRAAGGGVPRRIPTRGAACFGGDADLGRPARGCGNERARPRPGHLRPGRRRARGLPRHARLALAAGRTRRAIRLAIPRRVHRARRSARHLSRAPAGGGVRALGGDDPLDEAGAITLLELVLSHLDVA